MPFALRRAVAVPVLAACAVVAAPTHAPAATRPLARTAVAGRDYRAGEVVVRYARTAPGPTQRVIHVRGDVGRAAARLTRRPHVVSASPNWIAHAAYIPNDPGTTGQVGGWMATQWNFLNTPAGVDAPDAWDHLIAVGKPGGLGVTVAVLDTGIAYRALGTRFKRDPDFSQRLRRGYDFVDNDHYAVDQNGHGTHVASTIAEASDNGLALTGLAYGATIMPVRVLDRLGEGDSAAIASGIRYAAKQGAKIINLSFEFSATVTAGEIPDILSALRYAHRKGSLVVAASGNAASASIAYPARASHVLSVGAITEHACQADYSNSGAQLDLSAPGGGPDADATGDPNCHPEQDPGRDIIQMTFDGSVRKFGLPDGYMGTSMAAPHVSATAALVVASGVLGPNPTPDAIERRLKATADDLGAPGTDSRYGAGKVNAGRATAPIAPPPAK
jgi:serine protease